MDKPKRRTDDRLLSLEERLAKHSVLDEDTSCMVWQLATSKGYGVISLKGKLLRAHRVSYQLHVGSLEEGSVVHHVCANRACINPEHLQQVSTINNTAEMIERQYYLSRIAELEKELANGK